MSTGNPTTRKRFNRRWATPLVAITIGVAYLVAGWLGGDRFFGVFGFAVMLAAAAALLLLSRLSETVAGLLDHGDERINMIDLEATTIAGMTVIVGVIVGFVVEIARGQDGSPYSILGALGGVAYIAALGVLRFRR